MRRVGRGVHSHGRGVLEEHLEGEHEVVSRVEERGQLLFDGAVGPLGEDVGDDSEPLVVDLDSLEVQVVPDLDVWVLRDEVFEVQIERLGLGAVPQQLEVRVGGEEVGVVSDEARGLGERSVLWPFR